MALRPILSSFLFFLLFGVGVLVLVGLSIGVTQQPRTKAPYYDHDDENNNNLIILKEEEDEQRRRHLLNFFFIDWFFYSPNCPPPGFDALNPFDIDSYISALWYPVKAAPVIYAQGTSYCSVVQYTRDESCFFLCGDNPRIQVRNRGRQGSIDGPVNGANGLLGAFVPDPTNNPAKLKVSGLQRFAWWTNYWVVAAGTYDDALAAHNGTGSPLQPQPTSNQYDWAIIAGATPFRETVRNKCMPGFGAWDTRGLWMFARDPEPPLGVVEAVEALADSMGLDTTEWQPNVQAGCVHPTF